MRITGALATSLALHLAAAMLYFSLLPGESNRQFLSKIIGSRQEILATLSPPPGFNNQLSTPLPLAADSVDQVHESDSFPAESTTNNQQAAAKHEAQASSGDLIRYFERHEVDRPPRIIDNLDAKDGPLEKALAEFDIDGTIVIECWIGDRGSVDRLNVVNTTLPDTVVDIIVEQAKLAIYIPARFNHKAVPSRILIELSIRKKPKAPPA